MSLRQAAEMALEALRYTTDHLPAKTGVERYVDDAVTALQVALAQPEQEPVGYVTNSGTSAWILKDIDLDDDTPLYTAPPKRKWVGLTDEEVIKCFDSVAFGQVEDDLIINKHVNIFRAIHGIEARLKDKNT